MDKKKTALRYAAIFTGTLLGSMLGVLTGRLARGHW